MLSETGLNGKHSWLFSTEAGPPLALGPVESMAGMKYCSANDRPGSEAPLGVVWLPIEVGQILRKLDQNFQRQLVTAIPSAPLERAGFLTIQEAQTPYCFQSSSSSNPGPALCILSGIYVDIDRPAIFNLLHLMAQINWLLKYFITELYYKYIFHWSEQKSR